MSGHCLCKCSDNGGKESNKEGGGLNRCGACRLVRYCGRTCQRTGWNDGHKYECGGFKKHRIIPGSFARLLLRAVVKLQVNNPNNGYRNINYKASV